MVSKWSRETKTYYARRDAYVQKSEPSRHEAESLCETSTQTLDAWGAQGFVGSSKEVRGGTEHPMTAHTEIEVLKGIQGVAQEMDEFSDADVVIAHWEIFDQSKMLAPYLLLSPADNFEFVQDTVAEENEYEIKGMLIVPFYSWEQALLRISRMRDALRNQFNEIGTARSAGGLDGVDIYSIINGSDIEPEYPPYAEVEFEKTIDPDFLFQVIIFQTRVDEY